MRYVVLAMLCLFSSTCCAEQLAANRLTNYPNLRPFLQQLLKDPHFGDDHSTRVILGSTQLHEGGAKEIFVYVAADTWCGSGGCAAFLLHPTDSTYQVISKFTIVKLPVRVLDTVTDGWRDISVHVGGGGAGSGYDARLRYNGKSYPSNPSRPPAEKLPATSSGEILIPANAEGEPLYRD